MGHHIHPKGDQTMFRKSLIALATITTVAVAALPSAASAKGGHHGRGFRVGVIGLGVVSTGVVTSCYRYRWVETKFGLRRVLVNVCAY